MAIETITGIEICIGHLKNKGFENMRHRIGYKSPLTYELTNSYAESKTGDFESLIIPKSSLSDPPVLLWVSYLRDFGKLDLSQSQLVEVLKNFNPGKKIRMFGSNFCSFGALDHKDLNGVESINIHHAIVSDYALCTATVQVFRGRESESEVDGVRYNMPLLIESISRV